MSGIVGVDVGGTFTDLFHLDEAGRSAIVKVPTTPDDPARGVAEALGAAAVDGASLAEFLHGTTIATNAVIERRGAKCALITSRGFRDVLELGRRDRPHVYGLGGKHEPLIPRDRRWEVDERLAYDGGVIVPLAEDQVRDLAHALREDAELETVVVSYLHSYVSAEHEIRTEEILREVEPDWHVVTSSSVLREYYEFERTSTAVVQGYLEPIVSRYAAKLIDHLEECGIRCAPLIMQSNGGLVPATEASSHAARLIRSGPAAGVIAAARVAAGAGYDHVITGDMGGTSFDVSVSVGGTPVEADTTLLDFRLPVRVPMLDIRTIGAGGGSIGQVDRGGILQVGPRSAGSVPGPVAFGRGGTEPTVTDANVVLGRIDAEHPIGAHGLGRLDLDGARAALGRLGERLGLEPEEAAVAILAVVNNRMASEIRLMTVERGHDPRDFAFIAFGGAGPLHGAALMREIEIGRMILPPHPGVLCALGCAVADVRHDFSQTVETVLPQAGGGDRRGADAEQLREVFQRQRHEGERLLVREGGDFESVEVSHEADMAYEGQVHRLRVGVEPEWGAEDLRRAFVAAYEREYAAVLDDVDVTVVNLRTKVNGTRRPLGIASAPLGTGPVLPKARRPVHFGEWVETPVFERTDLRPGTELEGPMIVEQPDTTAVIEPGMRIAVDDAGNLIVTLA